ARHQRDEVGELAAQLATDSVAGAVVDVAGAGGAEGREIEEVPRPGEEWRQGRAEDAGDLDVDKTTDSVAAEERDFRVGAQLAVEREELAEGIVIGHPDLGGGPAAAVAETQDRQERPTVGGLDLDPRSVEVSGDIIEDSQAAQAGEIAIQLGRVEGVARPGGGEPMHGLPRGPSGAREGHVQPGWE